MIYQGDQTLAACPYRHQYGLWHRQPVPRQHGNCLKLHLVPQLARDTVRQPARTSGTARRRRIALVVLDDAGSPSV